MILKKKPLHLGPFSGEVQIYFPLPASGELFVFCLFARILIEFWSPVL